MTECQNEDFVQRRYRLQAVLARAAADFLEREGGLRLRDIREGFRTALQLLVVTKIEGSPLPSADPSDGEQ